MFRFDRSERSVVAVCTSCGARDVAAGQAAADSWASDHLDRCTVTVSAASRAAALAASRVRAHRRRAT